MLNEMMMAGKMIPAKVAHSIEVGKAALTGGFSQVTINNQTLGTFDPFSMFGTAIGIFLGLIQLVGIIVIIVGFVMFGQSFHEDSSPDKRSKSFMVVGGGIILVGIKWLLQVLGLIA